MHGKVLRFFLVSTVRQHACAWKCKLGGDKTHEMRVVGYSIKVSGLGSRPFPCGHGQLYTRQATREAHFNV